ncbi:hypothetical protein JCM19239_7415 [Vibrio variabilis]|uniref:Uncharacterized protein n=1 Tax=Vibrio variabilis TaxID=990271 RepID=A0ABQ0JMV3_9VIBR|nr:hypothetical protein JCM19239_7415 [Vibrio variabilis]
MYFWPSINLVPMLLIAFFFLVPQRDGNWYFGAEWMQSQL